MDVQEVRKLDAYLKKLFGNARLRVVPKKADAADVFVGEERISCRHVSTHVHSTTGLAQVSGVHS